MHCKEAGCLQMRAGIVYVNSWTATKMHKNKTYITSHILKHSMFLILEQAEEACALQQTALLT